VTPTYIRLALAVPLEHESEREQCLLDGICPSASSIEQDEKRASGIDLGENLVQNFQIRQGKVALRVAPAPPNLEVSQTHATALGSG